MFPHALTDDHVSLETLIVYPEIIPDQVVRVQMQLLYCLNIPVCYIFHYGLWAYVCVTTICNLISKPAAQKASIIENDYLLYLESGSRD